MTGAIQSLPSASLSIVLFLLKGEGDRVRPLNRRKDPLRLTSLPLLGTVDSLIPNWCYYYHSLCSVSKSQIVKICYDAVCSTFATLYNTLPLPIEHMHQLWIYLIELENVRQRTAFQRIESETRTIQLPVLAKIVILKAFLIKRLALL